MKDAKTEQELLRQINEVERQIALLQIQLTDLRRQRMGLQEDAADSRTLLNG